MDGSAELINQNGNQEVHPVDLALNCKVFFQINFQINNNLDCIMWYIANFWINPQFLFRIPDIDPMIRSENKTDVIIALMQKKSSFKRLQEPSHHETCDECIQFKIFKVFINYIFLNLIISN